LIDRIDMYFIVTNGTELYRARSIALIELAGIAIVVGLYLAVRRYRAIRRFR
jgi:hypothetical protein